MSTRAHPVLPGAAGHHPAGDGLGRRARRGSFAALVALLGAVMIIALPHVAPRRVKQAVQRVETTTIPDARASALRRELALATSDDFYLVLDPDAGALRLVLGGVTLREYGVRRLEIGCSRWDALRAGPPGGTVDTVWTGGHLMPRRVQPRVTMKPPPPGSDEPTEVPIPPDLETAIKVPAGYRLVYPGLVVTVESVDPATGTAVDRRLRDRLLGARFWLADRLAPLTPGTLRLRMTLARDDAVHLYRALPEGTGLTIGAAAPPGGGAGRAAAGGRG